MSTPPPATPGPSKARAAFDSFINSIRRIGIWRTDDRWIGGVAAGLAHRLGIDPLLMRLLIILVSLFAGIGLVLYGIAWLLLPEASDGRIHLQEISRGNTEAGFVGAALAIVLGLSGGPWITFGVMGPVASLYPFNVIVGLIVFAGLITLLVFMIRALSSKNRPTPWSAQPSTGAGPSPVVDPAGSTAPAGAAPFRPGDPMTTNDTTPTPTSALPGFAPGHSAGGAPPVPPGLGPVPSCLPPPPRAPYGPAARPASFAIPAPPIAPPVPRRQGAGPMVAALVAALTLFLVAGLILVDRYTSLLDHAFVPGIGIGAILIMAGLVIVALGIAGRRAGGVTAFSILATFLLLPALILLHVAATIPSGLDIGSRSWRPSSAESLTREFSVGIGQAQLDLSDIGAAHTDDTVTFVVGIGDAVLTLPRDVPVRIEADVNLGAIVSQLPDDWTTSYNSMVTIDDNREIRDDTVRIELHDGVRLGGRWNEGGGGVGVTAVFESPEVSHPDAPVLTVHATNNIGRLLVREGQ